MNLKEILNKIISDEFWNKSKIFCFVLQDPQPIFISKILPRDVQFLPLDNKETDKIIASLSQSFLGQEMIYFLGSLDAKKEKKILDFLKTYNGPHKVAFVINELDKPRENWLTCDLNYKIDFAMIQTIAKLLSSNLTPQKSALLSELIASQTFTLDEAVLLLDYLNFYSSRNISEFKYFLNRIFEKEHSLSSLSGYFFEKSPQKFFQLWEKIYKKYGDMFWIAFWSEQIWQAFNVVKLNNQREFMLAKRAGYRLPFSFINEHWKKYSLANLTEIQQGIYKIDCKIKQGGMPSFEQLFLSHLTLHK